MVVPATVAIATANLILERRAKATADAIAEQLKIRFPDRGWVQWTRKMGGSKIYLLNSRRKSIHCPRRGVVAVRAR
jgi:hypothetical protein